MTVRIPPAYRSEAVDENRRFKKEWYDFLKDKDVTSSLTESLTSGRILIGDASNLPAEHAVSGDATLSSVGLLTVSADAISNDKMANMAQTTIKGRAAAAGTGDPTDLTATQVIAILATADGTGSGLDSDLLDGQSGAYYLDSANFTGTNWTDLTDGGTTTLHTHTSGTANLITAADETSDSTCFLVFLTAATGDLAPKTNVNLAFDSTTGVMTFGANPAGTVIGSTYSPTRSAESNLDANVIMSQAQYMRVGATVTVSGTFTADPTATGAVSFEFTLPVASNIGAVEDVAGVAFCGAIAGQGAQITGSVANDTAVVTWIATDTTSQTWSYTFSYQII